MLWNLRGFLINVLYTEDVCLFLTKFQHLIQQTPVYSRNRDLNVNFCYINHR